MVPAITITSGTRWISPEAKTLLLQSFQPQGLRRNAQIPGAGDRGRDGELQHDGFEARGGDH
eukprot:224430-Rhodomonas_salina.1